MSKIGADSSSSRFSTGVTIRANSRRLDSTLHKSERRGTEKTDLHAVVERRFKQMDKAHDRIRSRELALRLASSEIKRGLGF